MPSRYLLLWLPMPFIGILNGILRQYGYAWSMDERTAHQISSFTGILLFGIYTWVIERKWPLSGAKQAVQIGLLWFLMTIVFEFIFGHYIMDHSWEHLLADYNIVEGRIWSLVLVSILLLPYVVYKLQHR